MQGRIAAYFDTGLTPEEIAVKMNTSVDQVKEVLEKQGVLELV
jgi:DNA-binding CsgD family transcriptional regulator